VALVVRGADMDDDADKIIVVTGALRIARCGGAVVVAAVVCCCEDEAFCEIHLHTRVSEDCVCKQQVTFVPAFFTTSVRFFFFGCFADWACFSSSPHLLCIRPKMMSSSEGTLANS